jgi:glycosyltransferase involved in cell wall biosynthesis
LITFIGTFGQWHGVDVLAETIRHLVETAEAWLRTRKVHFLFVGDGARRPAVEKILAEDRCQPYFTLAGLIPQEEAARCLASSDLLVSPHVPNSDGSRFFGSPTKLFEYMAMGKGIVASDLEQIGQVLRPALRAYELSTTSPTPHGDSIAVLVKPGDTSSLSEGIRFLVDHPDWRHHLGSNARRTVLGRYTWSHHVDAILLGLKMLSYP